VKDAEKEAVEKNKDNLKQIQQYFTNNGINAWDGNMGWQEIGAGDERMYYVLQPTTATLGRKPNTGDQVVVHYVGQLLNGTEFDKSAADKPLRFAYNDLSIIKGFNMGIGELRQGQKAELYMPSMLAYGGMAKGNIPAYSALKFTVNLEKIMTEDEALKDYISTKKLKNVDNSPIVPSAVTVASKTDSLYHIITKAGTGDSARLSNKITLSYRGTFLDGSEFDRGTINPTNTLQGLNLIKGFTEAVLKMKQGEKATVLMPSGLAYGDKGSGKVPPYAPLVFELELLKVE
jgi:FKBP-type peptidyl-prolyl cis-trans isomerase